MKICVFGAGAVGGQIGAQLARAGAEVSLIARGPHLAAIREKGLTLVTAEERFTVRPPASDEATDFGPQDYVIIALKAHSVPSAVERIQPLLGPKTAVVTAMNGVPWWYFHRLEGAYKGQRLASVDPGDAQWKAIGPERAIGCVLWQAAEIAEPGVIHLTFPNPIPLGEPDGSCSERVQALSRALIEAGIEAPVTRNIRDEIWIKLWGNLSLNPVSLLTGATLDRIVEDPETRAICRAMMGEARLVGEKLGVDFRIDVDERLDAAREVGAHKTSMLQDLERGRMIELDALSGAAIELGRLVGVPTPTIELVHGLARLRARVAGCYPQ